MSKKTDRSENTLWMLNRQLTHLLFLIKEEHKELRNASSYEKNIKVRDYGHMFVELKKIRKIYEGLNKEGFLPVEIIKGEEDEN